MELTAWLKEIEVVFQGEKFTGFQLRSYRPDRFMKMAARIEEYGNSCLSCKELKAEVNDVMIRLKNESQLNEVSFQIYIHLFRKMTDHLKSKHHLVYPQYYSSLYTLIGMVAGLVMGVLIWYVLFQPDDLFLNAGMGLMLSGFVGLFIGRLIGNRKDNMARELNKRLY